MADSSRLTTSAECSNSIYVLETACIRDATIALMPASNRLYWVALGVLGLVAFFAFAYPMYVIRPFRAQGARELAVALVVRSWGPGVAVCAAIAALTVAYLLWRRSLRWLPRTVVVLSTVLVVGFAALSHVNIYELMFHRIDAPEFIAADGAKLDADDMVLAVTVAGAARAYPIRMMGYHHIVNDRIGNVPVVATY